MGDFRSLTRRAPGPPGDSPRDMSAILFFEYYLVWFGRNPHRRGGAPDGDKAGGAGSGYGWA